MSNSRKTLKDSLQAAQLTTKSEAREEERRFDKQELTPNSNFPLTPECSSSECQYFMNKKKRIEKKKEFFSDLLVYKRSTCPHSLDMA